MALSVFWVGWRRPIAPQGRQRRRRSGRTSERSRDVVVGRVTFEVQGDENCVCGGLDCVRGVAGGLGCAQGLRRSRCPCSGGPTSRNGRLSPLNQPTTQHQLSSPASITWNMPGLGAQNPQIEFNFRLNSTQEVFFSFFVEFDFSQ